MQPDRHSEAGTRDCSKLCNVAVQERQREGIPGIYIKSLDERLDQQQLQKLLGEVIHHTQASLDGPPIHHQALATVALSR